MSAYLKHLFCLVSDDYFLLNIGSIRKICLTSPKQLSVRYFLYVVQSDNILFEDHSISLAKLS